MKLDKKIVRLKTPRNNSSRLNEKPLEILLDCLTFIDIYQSCKCNAGWALDYVDAQGRHFYNDESDENKCKMNLMELSGQDKNIRGFFWKKNIERFAKNQNKICELCMYYKSYKDTGTCKGLVYPIKNWIKKVSKVIK